MELGQKMAKLYRENNELAQIRARKLHVASKLLETRNQISKLEKWLVSARDSLRKSEENKAIMYSRNNNRRKVIETLKNEKRISEGHKYLQVTQSLLKRKSESLQIVKTETDKRIVDLTFQIQQIYPIQTVSLHEIPT